MSVNIKAEYQVCAIFATAVAYGDTSGLGDSDIEAFEEFEKENEKEGCWLSVDMGSDNDNTHWGRCDILGVDGEMVNVNLLESV